MRVAGLIAGMAVAVSAAVLVTPANAGPYSNVAGAMVRSAAPPIEAYRVDHGTYVGATLAKLRAYDRTLSSIENRVCAQGHLLLAGKRSRFLVSRRSRRTRSKRVREWRYALPARLSRLRLSSSVVLAGKRPSSIWFSTKPVDPRFRVTSRATNVASSPSG
jgi:hypothetical protein